MEKYINEKEINILKKVGGICLIGVYFLGYTAGVKKAKLNSIESYSRGFEKGIETFKSVLNK